MITEGAGYRVRLADWQRDGSKLLAVRRKVFVEEQAVPEELEVDGQDAECLHFVAEETASAAPIGAARLLLHGSSGKVGRVAVLRDWRGRGIGMALMRAVADEAAIRGLASLSLHAQEDSISFYEKLGFIATGPTFIEAGIPHRTMDLELG